MIGSMAHKFNKDPTDCYMFYWRQFSLQRRRCCRQRTWNWFFCLLQTTVLHLYHLKLNKCILTGIVTMCLVFVPIYIVVHCNVNIVGSLIYLLIFPHPYIILSHLAFTYSLKEPMTFSRLFNYVHGNNIIARK